MQLDWWWAILVTIGTSIVVSFCTVLVTQGVQSVLKSKTSERERKEFLQKNAFSVSLKYGDIWYIRKLTSPAAEDFMYRLADAETNIRPGDEIGPRLEPETDYGMRGIKLRDTIEVYWTESGVQYSTTQILHNEQVEYFLRRENTGH